VRTAFSPKDLPFILQAYVNGIQTAFIVAIALACTCTILAFGASWQKMQPASNVADGGVESSTKTDEAEAVV
jgi:hypothetical protein